MVMQFRCQCGQMFKAKDSWAGRKAACNACGTVLEIPFPLRAVGDSSASPPEAADSPPPDESTRSRSTGSPASTGGRASDAAERRRDSGASLWDDLNSTSGASAHGTSPTGTPPTGTPPTGTPTSPGPGSTNTSPVAVATPLPAMPMSPRERQLQRDLERFNRRTGSAASNPGLLRVNWWRYATAFPKWPLIWHSLFIPFALFTVLFHWAFAIGLLLVAAACVWYWKLVGAHFIGGCINPGIVLSTDPSLLAAHTNLSRSGEDWNCIKILPHPWAKMSTGPVVPFQRVATIATYQAMTNELPHWDNFFPKCVDLVSANEQDLTRIMMAVEPGEWDELLQALAQLPRPFQVGLYRIYPAARFQQPSLPQRESLIRQYLSLESRFVYFQPDIKPADLQAIVAKTGATNSPPLVLLEGRGVGEGMLLTNDSVAYHYRETGAGGFPWSDVVGAMYTEEGFEITLRNGRRVRIPGRHFLEGTVAAALEVVFNA